MKKFIPYALLVLLCFTGTAFASLKPDPKGTDLKKQAAALLKKQILAGAAWAMQQNPITVTASSSPRSAGGKHDLDRKSVV